ncbi:MAG TPA: SDR family NAD(P)-dependent oxidoreductase [Steroidobacteraceae bacterium]|jgi:NAD(P)-dependent dehydrogenase (short-subunit alcohol dehydrogenase family)|nr:SDR family NAD(P)-dependent oxidoreductase [Steroidobacteraceae bacterium]
METLKDKVAFVTGGASGIGLGISKAMVAAGMRVVIADLREDHLKDARAWFVSQKQSRRVRCVKLDVTNRRAYARAADQAEKAFGKIHVLVNNAGIGILGAIDKTRYDDWDWGLSVMIGGVINGLLTVLPRIRAHGEGGHVVNTSSMAAIVPIPNCSIYITAKSALVGLSECLAGELAPEKIGVSAFCPGPVQSNIRELGRLRPDKYKKDTGLGEFEKNLAQRPTSELWMDPMECGQRVVRGITSNTLYIFTHPEFKQGAKERFDKMLASFPDEPPNQARTEAIRFLLSNPIFK